MELTAPSFLVPGALHPALPSSAQPTRPTHSAKKQGSTLGLLALGAVSARVVARTRRAAYGYGGGGGYPRLSPEEQERTEQKRRREAAQFFAYQQRLLQTGPPVLDERHWGMQERRLFGSNHVVAGINFSKYDNIEVTTEGGTGREIPIKSFQEACERYNLPEELTANLERCAYNIPTPVQKYSIPAVLEGSDVMVTAQTGSGKTAAFLVPIITAALQAGPKELKEGAVCPTCVILAPTRELCQQITQEAKRLTFRSPARVQAIYGGEDAVMQLRNIAAGIEIVVCAPGRLDDFLQRGVISMEEVKFLVLDEADRMLDMGFEPQIRNIIETYNMPEPGEGGRQTMMFSATFPQEMQDMALDFLDPSYFGISVGKVGHAATDVEQYFEQVSFGGKFDRLFNLLGEVSEDNGVPKKTIVFANTKNMVDDITSQLQSQGIQSAAMHGGRLITPANCGALQSSGTSQMYRNRALSDVKSGRISVLVATDVAARGLDVPGIEHIVNFDLPTDGETYVHRIGRTGRIGNKGRATSFVSNREQSLKSIVRAMKEAKFDDPEASDVPDWLEEMAMSSSGGRGRR